MNTTDENFDVRLGSWDELKALALPIRVTVFVQEQGVPFEIEQDEYDDQAVHLVTFTPGNEAVATGRLVTIDKTIGKIGRLAVLKAYRGKGCGKVVMRALIKHAQALGLRELKLHAQCDAEPFYRSFGFVTQGEVFVEAGIEHVLMVSRI